MSGEEVGDVVEDEFDESGYELRVGDDDVDGLLTTIEHCGKAFGRGLGHPMLRQRFDSVPGRRKATCMKEGLVIAFTQNCAQKVFCPLRRAFCFASLLALDYVLL